MLNFIISSHTETYDIILEEIYFGREERNISSKIKPVPELYYPYQIVSRLLHAHKTDRFFACGGLRCFIS